MNISDVIEDYRYAISEHSQETQKWYLRQLQEFAEWCALAGLELDRMKASDVGRFLDMVRTTHLNPRTGDPVTDSTVSGYARTIKAFLNWCVRQGDYSVSVNVPARIAMPKVQDKVIEIFSDEQLATLFVACEKEYSEILRYRAKAILYILLDTGVRNSELCNLMLEHVHMPRKGQPYIKVLGKGKKEREIGMGEKARTTLSRYISRFRSAPEREQHVFLSRNHEQLTLYGLDEIVQRLGDFAGISGVRCSPHTFRHTFAIHFLRAGGDVYKLSRLMGHSSVTVTERYLKAFKALDARTEQISVLDTLKKRK